MSTVEDILMTKGPDVIIASARNMVLDVAKMMSQANVGSVIIKDDEAPAGIFTERDLLRKIVAARRDPATTPLSDVMTSPVTSVGLSTTIEECVDVLTREHIRHLAVVEDGALIGMISFRDVMAAGLRDAQDRCRKMTSHATQAQPN